MACLLCCYFCLPLPFFLILFLLSRSRWVLLSKVSPQSTLVVEGSFVLLVLRVHALHPLTFPVAPCGPLLSPYKLNFAGLLASNAALLRIAHQPAHLQVRTFWRFEGCHKTFRCPWSFLQFSPAQVLLPPGSITVNGFLATPISIFRFVGYVAT